MNKVSFMTNTRKGSALLIVIGFLSFMIVSAVSFSIYMRAERLPSSALRRTVATRQLAKAALAEAISRVDDAVRGSPFPGLNDQVTRGYQPRGDMENHWEGDRVFMPPNNEYSGNERRYAPAPQTVSVMTLEGLGYVPPPLVNDARFLGRSTWTASWQNLPYDAGRFAFIALNVSDFLDVNRLYANKPRSSNADGRISLSYLLDPNFRPMSNGTSGESSSVDGFSAGNLKQFDQRVHEQREGGNDKNPVGKDAPFVSMLDYQLSLKQGLSGLLPSMFYNWIDQSGADRLYYTAGGNELVWAGRQPFVTDSVATNEEWDVDIAYYQAPTGKKQKGQPFDKEVTQDSMSFMQVNAKAASSKFFTPLFNGKGGSTIKFANGLQSISMFAATMFDYLDHNDIPLSLAWPCVERVPSIASIEPAFQFNIPAIAEDKKGTTSTWNFDPNQWLQAGMLSTTWVFPYKRNEADRNDTFKAQAVMRVFLAPDGLTLRAAEGLGMVLRPQKDADWTGKADLFSLNNLKNVFCLTFVLGDQNIALKNNVKVEDEAGGEAQFPVNIGGLGAATQMPLVTRTTTEDPKTHQKIEKYTINVSPLDLKGQAMFPVGTEMDKSAFDALAGTQLRLYTAVWVRILNGDNKVVDMVPAVMEDDMAYNGGNSQVPALSEYLLQATDGPLIRFKGSVGFSFAGMVSGGAAGGQVTWEPTAFSTVDPRFNWAPEDWYATDSVKNFTAWLDKTTAYLNGGAARNFGCDRDIFCAVSNQGFLQSLGEFAFLPRLTDIDNAGVPLMAVRQAAGGYDGVVRTQPQDIANRRCAWCSYEMSWEVYEALNQCGIGRSTSRECLVNPYTPSRDIFMAALANTPCDYWAAGAALDDENKLKQTLGDTQNTPVINDAVEGLQYAFCENKSKSGQSRLRYKELDQIARVLQSTLRNEANISEGATHVGSKLAADAWKYIWDEKLNWFDYGNNPENFLGVTLDEPLYGIDRKFLYSYWRDCFADQQQLFLIFVRAESSAIGGPGEGTPGQKGARAVALVWRNPVPTMDTGTGSDGRIGDNSTAWIDDRRPHQTRILFYRQLD